MRIPLMFLIVAVCITAINCGGDTDYDSSYQGGDLVRCAPKFQEANFGSELKRPYIVPPRVRYMIGEQGKNGQEIFCSIELLDASGGVLDDFEFRVRTDTEIDIDGSNNTVVEADGFLTYPYFGPVSSDAAYVEMAFRVEGGS